MTRTGKRLAAVALAAVALASLAGCGGADVTDGPSMACDGSVSSKECTVTMTDGRRVPCIVIDGDRYRSGISCDWAHADGADNQDESGR